MKTTKILVVALVLLSSFPILARQTDAGVQQNSSAQAAGAQTNQSAAAGAQVSRHGGRAQGSGSANGSGAISGVGSANGSANGSAAGAADFRPVQGELASKLDSKHARVGDPVLFKTSQKARTADGTVLPKGTRILGHVTQVQAHSKSSEESQLGVVFDRAELKGGRSLPIHSMIESISPSPAAMAMANGSADSDLFASPMMGAPMGGGMVAGGGQVAGGAPSGGGLLGGGGGAMRGAAGRAGSLAGNTVNTAGSMAGNGSANLGRGAVSAAGNGAANAGGSLRGAGLNGAAAGSGLLAARPTGFPGVMLAGDATGSASGVLSASRRNIHLDSGTQMVLGVSSVLAQ